MRGARERRFGAWRGGSGVLAVVAAALVGCGGSAAGGRVDPAPMGCPPGLTPLAPRTLGAGPFTGLALEAGDVLATADSEVRRFPLTGDPATTLTHMGTVSGLLVAGGKAYFSADVTVGMANAEGKTSSAPALFSMPLAGGEPTLVLDGFVDLSTAVADAEAMYFASPGAITRLALADGARTELTLTRGLAPDALALHAGVLYVAAQDLTSASATNGVIVKVPTAGGAAETLVADIGHPWSLVADATGLYWSEDPPIGQFAASHVVHAGLDGGGATVALEHGARSLVVSDGALYVASDGISRVPIGGGAETTLVGGLMGPGMLAVGAGNAVWVDPQFPRLSATTPPALMTTCW